MSLKLDHVSSPALRGWVEDYTETKLAERKSKKLGTDDLRRMWAGFRESDWEAWRELVDLRPRARAKFEQADIDIAVARKLQSLAPVHLNGQTYPAPFTLGLEVAALRELLGETDPTPRVVVDFIP